MEQVSATPPDPDDALAGARALRLLADQIEEDAVASAIRSGWTWAEIAEAMGVSRQAAHKRFAQRLTEET